MIDVARRASLDASDLPDALASDDPTALTDEQLEALGADALRALVRAHREREEGLDGRDGDVPAGTPRGDVSAETRLTTPARAPAIEP